MKAVLMSIRPQWCRKIMEGSKTVEVRKSEPKLKPPFRVYIYCTKGSGKNTLNAPVGYETILKDYLDNGSMDCINAKIGNCKVIGEFLCDHIYRFTTGYHVDGTDISAAKIAPMTGLTLDELQRYENSAEPKENCLYLVGLYGWHISDLKVYENPRMLSEFRNPCKEYEKDDPQCGNCDFYHSMGEYPAECGCEGAKPLIRPPQSWCYVEDRNARRLTEQIDGGGDGGGGTAV